MLLDGLRAQAAAADLPGEQETRKAILAFKSAVRAHHLTGSTALYGEGADLDIVVLPDDAEAFAEEADELGYEMCGESYGDDRYIIVRDAEARNLIICRTAADYWKWHSALQVCLYLVKSGALRPTKEERGAVFSMILGESDHTAWVSPQ